MYTYKDASYTDDQIKKAAKQSNMTVKEYLKKLEGDKDPEPKIKDGDLLDPNFQQDAAAGADVVSQPMTASQAGREQRYGITLGRYFFGFSKS